MPGPIIKTPKLPFYADPATESVTDPLYQTMLKRASKFFGMDDPQSIMQVGGPLVAGVPPDRIGALRQAGRELLDRVKREGVEKRSFGQRPMTTEGLKAWHTLPWQERANNVVPEEYYHPNKPLPQSIIDQLEFAQKKWPRIFGHITDITDVESFHSLKAFPNTIHGAVTEVASKPKFSHMYLNPHVPKVDPTLVGHELLHTADRIVDPKMQEVYNQSLKLPGNYDASQFERRARVQGERFMNMMKGTPNPKPLSIRTIEDMMEKSGQAAPKPEAILDPGFRNQSMPRAEGFQDLLKKLGWGK